MQYAGDLRLEKHGEKGQKWLIQQYSDPRTRATNSVPRTRTTKQNLDPRCMGKNITQK
jgi:hypothetical protein